jgi:hypothetical protein
MKLNDIQLIPHIEGYVFAQMEEGGPALVMTGTVHDTLREGAERQYVKHPLHDKVAAQGALKSIPVRVLFDTPESNIMARYEAWSTHEGEPTCIGDGESGKRLDSVTGAWQAVPCRGPGLCEAARTGKQKCALTARMRMRVDCQDDQLSVFELRTNSLNSYASIRGTLAQLKATYGHLRGLPLELKPWQKSTRGSSFEPFACVRVALAPGEHQKLDHKVDEAWEAYGASALQTWVAEVVPTEHEGLGAAVVVAPRARVAERAESASTSNLFGGAVEAARTMHTESQNAI